MPPIREPLALVGIGCRFPGNADSPTAFWELLRNGEDAITDVPVDRWSLRRFYHPNPDAPGKAYVRQGGFLRGAISSFEPAFFGITPREAAALDPQQRVLLEVTYEAFEDAGLSLDAVRGANIGVYIGAFTMDNLSQQLGVLSREAITTHTAVATTMTMLSNRLSYTFDLRGTSLSLDTACSSSLVAFHLACQAVWNGECEAALAGGVNIMFRPEFVIAMCKGHFLSPDARCKAFDAAANGYVRGEGAGVVLLKPLSQALADGDRIYALVRGTGSNQDGRTAGITLPNEAAQESLVQTVCAAAGIAGGQVAYVEAHGTGTAAGDPIEARSLSAALQAERTTPLWIGSVKTNIGHLEAAAGVAGVIKAALILYHKQIPPHLHFRTANPEIDLDALRLRIPLKVEPLPAVAGESYVGINSFGYGGTNAHAILSNAPPPTEAEDDPALSSSVYAVPLSARSSEALHQTAAAHAAHLTAYPRLPLADYAYTVSRRRTAHPLRAVAFASDRPSLLARLGEIAEGSGINGVGQTARRLVFVYTGMGPQWWGMGVELYRESPTFRAVIDECEALFRQIAPPDVSIHALFVAGDRQGAVMSDPIHAQPGNFALQAGLTALWREMGVIPAAIVGHSAGEIAAAYAAGTLTLYDALWVTYWRASLMQRTVGQGAMLAASIPPTEANAMLAAALNGEAQWVSIAALNSPTSVTLAGAPEALEKVAAHLTERGIFNAFLKVAVAYHSYQMSPLEGDFRAGLGDVHPAAPMIPLYSTVTGGRVGAGDHTTDYWWQNAQQPVQLAPAIQAISGEGGDAFLEIGPHPVLGTAILETLRAEGREGITFPSLRRGKPERETLHVALGGLWAGGVAVDWACWSPSGRIVSLPTYAWQRDTLWAETPRASADRLTPDEHPLLQRRLPTPEPTWEGDLGAYFLDYLRDHRVQGTPIFPAAGYVEALLAAAGTLPVTLERLRFSQALSLESAASICLTERAGAVTISSRTVDDHWTTHATGTILTKALPIGDGQRPHLSGAALESIYPALAERGLPYGESFRPIRALWRAEQKVTAALALPDGLAEDYERYHLHPVLLDGALQTFFAFLDEAAEGLFIPTGIQRVRLHRQAPRGRVWSVARLTRRAVRFVEGDVRLYDEAGGVIAELEGVRLTRLAGWKHETPEVLYHLAWVAQAPIQGHPAAISAIHETNDSHPPSVTLIFADSVGMARVIGGAGTHDAVYVLRGQTFRADAAGVTLNPNDPEGWAALFAHPPTRFERILCVGH
ncbi:MAG: type I polyketide synthase [Anaerolineales bacterium]|nr:type I polyketide synthase [Anaerolineales bacterium]